MGLSLVRVAHHLDTWSVSAVATWQASHRVGAHLDMLSAGGLLPFFVRVAPVSRVAVATVGNHPASGAEGFHLDFGREIVIVIVDPNADGRALVLYLDAPSVLSSELGAAGKRSEGVVSSAVIVAFVPQVVTGDPPKGLCGLAHTEREAGFGGLGSNGQGGSRDEEEIELDHDDEKLFRRPNVERKSLILRIFFFEWHIGSRRLAVYLSTVGWFEMLKNCEK